MYSRHYPVQNLILPLLVPRFWIYWLLGIMSIDVACPHLDFAFEVVVIVEGLGILLVVDYVLDVVVVVRSHNSLVVEMYVMGIVAVVLDVDVDVDVDVDGSRCWVKEEEEDGSRFVVAAHKRGVVYVGRDSKGVHYSHGVVEVVGDYELFPLLQSFGLPISC